MEKFDPIQWLCRNFKLKQTSFGEFFYGRISEWSPQKILGINCLFDATKNENFISKGQELDFIISVGGGKILDFGPGDGWPALRLAPYIEKVVGIEGSKQRVKICQQNALKAGLKNTEFIFVKPGCSLPFPNESFDGIVASWSLEETPDLTLTLKELWRIMRLGATLRFERVPMSFFTSMAEIPMYVGTTVEGRTIVLIAQPDVSRQIVNYCGILMDLNLEIFNKIFSDNNLTRSFENLTQDILGNLQPKILEVARWKTQNPSCFDWLRWLPEIGFSQVETTYGGAWAAKKYLEEIIPSQLPATEDEVEKILRPLVEEAVKLKAPVDQDFPITAIK